MSETIHSLKAKLYAAENGIEITSYYEYLKDVCCHAYNGVQQKEDGLWYSIRIVVFLAEDGSIKAEEPRSRQKPFGYRAREDAIY